MIHQSDHDRAGYNKYFFNAAWDSSTDFDLVVNTAGVSAAETCDLVSTLRSSPAYSGAGARARDKLLDLRIAQDVVVAIVHRERVPVISLDVACDKGVVALDGATRSQAAIDRCIATAGTVEGVTKVVSKLEIVEHTYYPGI